MMRSLSSAVGGLRAHQQRMDVIGNNIANVNTYGFKSSRVTFRDVYYQTLSGGSAPNSPQLGGTNPTQIGYGAAVASIDVLNSVSGASSTDRALDVYINGDGMIAVKDSTGNLKYTRLGVLGFDAEGYLVDSMGNYVMGFPMDNDGNPVINPDGSIDAGQLREIQIDGDMLDQMTGISIGTSGEIVGVMPGETTFNQANGLPTWLTGITIKEGSNLSGKVNITMDRISNTTDNPISLANWLSSITPAKNSGVEGSYSFRYDANNKLIIAEGPNGERYTGSYVKGGSVDLKDASGNTMFTAVTQQYVNPPTAGDNNPIGNATYTVSLELNMTATDKGGNTVTAGPIVYDGYSTTVVMNDDITLTLDPAAVQNIMDPNFTYNNDASVNLYDIDATGGWLNTVVAGDNASYTQGQMSLLAVREAIGKITLNSGNQASKFLNDAVIRQAVEAYYSANPGDINNASSLKVVWKEDSLTPGNFILNVVDKNGDTIATTGSFTPGADIYLTPTGGTQIADKVNKNNSYTLIDNPNGESIGSATIQNSIYMYDADGNAISDAVQFKLGQSIIRVGEMVLDVDPNNLEAFFNNLQASNTVVPSFQNNTGTVPAGAQNVGDFSVDEIPDWKFNSSVGTATAADGEKITIGVIALANVPNMAAMEQAGDSYFLESSNSGEITFTRPGLNGVGPLKAGYLEMSNVDISKEFTDMITTQRGFQANTRIITVSDEMLNELVNLKR